VEGSNSCLVLEPLAKTLCQLSADHGYYGFSLSIVKNLAWQILVALAQLCQPGIGVIHADLKPDNIMLKERLHKKVKIVDFGSAFYTVARKAKYIQSRFYRSPEVILGYPCTSAVDMWSVGCILYELHTGKPLFNGANELEQIAKFTKIRGPIPEIMVQKSPKCDNFYNLISEGDDIPSVKFKLIENPKFNDFPIQTLQSLLNIENGGPEEKWKNDKIHTKEHYELFIDLLDKMLEYDPTKRIKPLDALDHAFFKNFLNEGVKFPSVIIGSSPIMNEPESMIQPENEIEPMILENNETRPKNETFPYLTLSEPLDDPQDVELLCDLSKLCKQIASKRTLLSSSTKDSCKISMIRKILSIPSESQEPQPKHQIDSIKSDSKADLQGIYVPREVTSLDKTCEEIKVANNELRKDTPPWPINSIFILIYLTI